MSHIFVLSAGNAGVAAARRGVVSPLESQVIRATGHGRATDATMPLVAV